MASLYVNTASDYHIGFGYGWGNGRFGGGGRRGSVVDGGQWSTLQEDDRSKLGLNNPGSYAPYPDMRGDRLITALLEEQSEADTFSEATAYWGKGKCYREEWFGGGYANVTREQRERLTRGQFVKDTGLTVAGVGTLGKREHDDNDELVGEKRRQAETRVRDGIGQGRLVCDSKGIRGGEIGTFGDFKSCTGVFDMDLMTEGFKDEAIVLEKYGQCGGDLVNERPVLDWGGSTSLWEEALDACLEAAEGPILKQGIDYHGDDEHGSLVHSRRDRLTTLCSSSSEPIIGQLMGRAASSYMKGMLPGCNLEEVWSDTRYVQPGSSFKENMLGEVRDRQLWEEDEKLVEDLNLCVRKSGYLRGEGGQGLTGDVDHKESEGPPEGFVFALSHLDLRSLLTLERVSKSIRDTVIGDVLIWQHLNVVPPLSMSITDDVLVTLARRAEGRLKSLTLVDCIRITSAGLEQVLSFSPELEKLCIPRCTGIKAEAIVRMVETHALESRSRGLAGIKMLRIKGVYNITRQQLDILLGVLQHGRDQQEVHKLYRPYYYRHGNYSFTRELVSDDERPIDVEPCPKCGNARVVYDCTRERCKQEKAHPGLSCRGCTLCIARCEECGTCINDLPYEETFCLDLLCSACWYRLPKCTECNKPGCGRHVEDFSSADTTFTCEDCCASAAGPEFHAPGNM